MFRLEDLSCIQETPMSPEELAQEIIHHDEYYADCYAAREENPQGK